MANSFLEFIPIIALMGAFVFTAIFSNLKNALKNHQRVKLPYKMSFFVVFIKNNHFLAEFF